MKPDPTRDVYILAVTVPTWLIVNSLLPITPDGRSAIELIAYWVVTGRLFASEIAPVTVASSVATFGIAFYVFRLRLGKPAYLAIALSLTTPFFGAGFFEVVYQNLFYFFRPPLFHTNLPGEIVLFSWCFLGCTTIGHWRVSRAFFAAPIVFCAAFGAWLVLGYPQIFEVGSLVAVAVVLNAVAKVAAFSILLLLLLEGSRRMSLTNRFRPRSLLLSGAPLHLADDIVPL